MRGVICEKKGNRSAAACGAARPARMSSGVTILAPADRGVEERQRVVEYVRAGKVDMTPFLGTVVPCAEMPAYYRKLQKREIVSLIGDWRA